MADRGATVVITDSLTAVARQRTVLATIADAIVAAATGKQLHVVVGCTGPDETGFADHLARALHARGRLCQCVPLRPGPDSPARPNGHRDARLATVIVGGSPDPSGSTPCRVGIRLETAATAGPGDLRRPTDFATGDPSAENVHEHADIVVDYHDPDGPVIRNIQPTLAHTVPTR